MPNYVLKTQMRKTTKNRICFAESIQIFFKRELDKTYKENASMDERKHRFLKIKEKIICLKENILENKLLHC